MAAAELAAVYHQEQEQQILEASQALVKTWQPALEAVLLSYDSSLFSSCTGSLAAGFLEGEEGKGGVPVAVEWFGGKGDLETFEGLQRKLSQAQQKRNALSQKYLLSLSAIEKTDILVELEQLEDQENKLFTGLIGELGTVQLTIGGGFGPGIEPLAPSFSDLKDTPLYKQAQDTSQETKDKGSNKLAKAVTGTVGLASIGALAGGAVPPAIVEQAKQPAQPATVTFEVKDGKVVVSEEKPGRIGRASLAQKFRGAPVQEVKARGPNPPSPAEPIIHTVSTNENLSSICQKHGCDPSQVFIDNKGKWGVVNQDLIYPGAVLIIHPPGGSPEINGASEQEEVSISAASEFMPTPTPGSTVVAEVGSQRVYLENYMGDWVGVKRGDSLEVIAQRAGVSVKTLKTWNPQWQGDDWPKMGGDLWGLWLRTGQPRIEKASGGLSEDRGEKIIQADTTALPEGVQVLSEEDSGYGFVSEGGETKWVHVKTFLGNLKQVAFQTAEKIVTGVVSAVAGSPKPAEAAVISDGGGKLGASGPEYVVQPGDTLYDIGMKKGMGYAVIDILNPNIPRGGALREGQNIVIPQGKWVPVIQESPLLVLKEQTDGSWLAEPNGAWVTTEYEARAKVYGIVYDYGPDGRVRKFVLVMPDKPFGQTPSLVDASALDLSGLSSGGFTPEVSSTMGYMGKKLHIEGSSVSFQPDQPTAPVPEPSTGGQEVGGVTVWSGANVETAIDAALARGEIKVSIPSQAEVKGVEYKKSGGSWHGKHLIGMSGLSTNEQIPATVGGRVEFTVLGGGAEWNILTIRHGSYEYNYCIPKTGIEVLVTSGDISAGTPILRITNANTLLSLKDFSSGSQVAIAVTKNDLNDIFSLSSNNLLKDEEGNRVGM